MEEVNLVVEALKFMVLGMAVVLSFLIIMIFVLKIQAKVIAKYFPEKPKEVSEWKPQTVQSSSTDDKDITAAITAAIMHYNKQKG